MTSLIFSYPVIHHAPISGVGVRLCKAYDVALVRYDQPRPISPPRPLLSLPHHLLAHAEITVPSSAVGPVEAFPVEVSIQPRPGITPQRITLSIKRRVELYNEAGPSRSPLNTSPSFFRRPLAESPNVSSSSGDDTTVTGSDDDDETVIPDDEPSAAKSVHSTLTTESSTLDRRWSESMRSDVYSRQLSMHMPHAKSNHYWAIGESMRTSLAHVKFVVSAKVSRSLIPSIKHDL